MLACRGDAARAMDHERASVFENKPQLLERLPLRWGTKRVVWLLEAALLLEALLRRGLGGGPVNVFFITKCWFNYFRVQRGSRGRGHVAQFGHALRCVGAKVGRQRLQLLGGLKQE